MNIPNSHAIDAITECFCKTFRAEKGSIGCLDCPLHKIKSKYGASICSYYASIYDDERLQLLKACIEHGNTTIYKDLLPEYRIFVTRTVTVI